MNPCVTHTDLRQNFREQFSMNFWSGDTSIAEHIFYGTTLGDITGHGTHVAGILAATAQNSSGVAGGCWTCSLAEIKTTTDDATVNSAITFAVDHGIQVLNMSFGDAPTPTFSHCGDGTRDATCSAIAFAVERDVVMVASSGNFGVNRIQFPATHPDTIAAGGLEYGGVFWRDGYAAGCSPGSTGSECGSNYGLQSDGTSQQVVAPARDVVSTFYPGYSYRSDLHCGDTYGPNSGALSSGYGDCTGTSMSSPHVAGLVALMRSANPLMSKGAIKNALYASTGPCTGTDSSKCGAGIPDAGKAVRNALGSSAKNRLTPLFSLYSAIGSDHVYTVVPQMAIAALNSGQLLPQPGGELFHSPIPTSISYGPIGNLVPGYSQFPDCTFSPCVTPLAMVSVFTSYVDPTAPSTELVPLYRMSWSCSGTCSHVSHTYTTSSTGISAFQSVGYVLDGIEGYIYPSTKAQPAGTVKLCRKYSPTGDDYIIFPGTGAGGATCGNGDGFTKDSSGVVRTDYTGTVGGTDWIGWVYPVRASQAICNNAIPCSVLAGIVSTLVGGDWASPRFPDSSFKCVGLQIAAQTQSG